MRVIDRFDEYMQVRRLNDNKVTLQLGLSNGVIGKSRKPGRDLSDKVIEKISKFYTDLNRAWLLTGEGEMLREPGSAPEVNEKSPAGIFVPAELAQLFTDLAATVRSQQETIRALVDARMEGKKNVG